MELEGINFARVRFLYKNQYVCSFSVENYAEYIKFLHYCKIYEVEFFPHEADDKIPEKFQEEMAGLGGLVSDYWVEFGSDQVLPTICVELGGEE